MKKLVVISLVGLTLMAGMSSAEAGMGTWLKNSGGYLYRPVPALWNYGTGLVQCAVSKTLIFVKEVSGNLNANPATLDPVLPPPVPQPDVT